MSGQLLAMKTLLTSPVRIALIVRFVPMMRLLFFKPNLSSSIEINPPNILRIVEVFFSTEPRQLAVFDSLAFAIVSTKNETLFIKVWLHSF
jgi:hypothetical protein